MTVIAYKDGIMAADKRAVNVGLNRTVTKIKKIHGNLVGVCGDADKIAMLFDWLERGGDPKDYPEFQKTDYSGLLVITPFKDIWKFESQPLPIVIEDSFFAMGSGRDYAITAMHMGATAIEAVKVACEFDVSCGNGVDVISL